MWRQSATGGHQSRGDFVVMSLPARRLMVASVVRPSQWCRVIALVLDIDVGALPDQTGDQAMEPEIRRPVQRGLLECAAIVRPRSGIE